MKNKQTIAIIGMAGRFPKANNLKEFWELLINEEQTVTEIPKSRWDLNEFFDPDPTAPNKSYQKHGSFLENIHDLDPLLFNVSPAEAIEMSPSQKLMLELTWETIEESGIAFDKVCGKKVGVYIGNIWSDFEHVRKHRNANTTSHSAMGQSANIIANRVSYTFGFSGPSLVVDTGCSSSLVALQLACQSIWDGGSDMAIVGGINHILDHEQNILLAKFGGLSTSGRCSAFSAEADGFVRGEGGGTVLIKRLCDAEADGDTIIGLVKGVGMNNNGYNENLPATSQKGQHEMLVEAYRQSGISPSEVQYVEAHGTGTKLGDPNEAIALGKFFSSERSEDQPLKIGSIKTNIGHLEGAAGMAGLLKVLLAIRHQKIPASLNFKNPNPKIPFQELKLKVNNTTTAWEVKDGETRKAGVNSFGWGGTNAHTVIEEYITPVTKTRELIEEQTDHLLSISAKNEQSLKRLAELYVEKINGLKSPQEITALCQASAINRPNLDNRLSVTGRNAEEISGKLKVYIEEERTISPTLLSETKKIVFVFPGQGSQWLGMGKELYSTEVSFRETIDACEQAFLPYVNWSLKDQIFADESVSLLSEIDVIQPLLFAIEIALAKLWMDKGIKPDAVVGHSMGEVASAYISGAINLEDAANIICSRSKLMKTVSKTGGAMAVTELTQQEAEEIIAPYQGILSVAVSNSPKSTVIAGNETELLEVLKELESKDLFCRQVKVDVASHSPQMDSLMPLLGHQLSGLQTLENTIPFYSTVQSKLVDGKELNADYWVSNLRGKVRFSEVIDLLIATDHSIFIEMSPHQVLTNAIQECAEANHLSVVAVGSGKREAPEKITFLEQVGQLFDQGLNMDWRSFYKKDKAPVIDLPPYPMQKATYELEDRSGQKDLAMSKNKNPLLGRRIPLAGISDTYVWENKLSLEHLPYMNDHKVNDAVVLPGVSYLEILYSALQEAFGNAFHQVVNLDFKTPVFLNENETIDAQLKINVADQHNASFTFYTRTSSENETDWLISSQGLLKICGSHDQVSTDYLSNLHHGKKDVIISKEEFYKHADSIGIQYGDKFQGINWVRINDRQTIAHIIPNEMIAVQDHNYFIHPAILDSCFQTIFSTVTTWEKENHNYTTFLSQLKGFKWLYKPEKEDELLVKADLIDSNTLDNGVTKLQVSLSIYDENGNFLASLEMLEAIIMDNDRMEKEGSSDWFYNTKWHHALIDTEIINREEGNWLIFEDHLGVEKMLRKQFSKDGINLIQVAFGDEFSKIDDQRYIVNFMDHKSIEQLFSHLISAHVFVDGIIHGSSLNDHINYIDLTTKELTMIQEFGSQLLINIHKAIQHTLADTLPKIVVLTNGLLPIGNKNTHLNISQAATWGIAKVLFNEQPAYQCRRVDISYFPDEREIKLLYDLILMKKIKEPEIALRGTQTFVSRLEKEIFPSVSLDEVSFNSEKTMIVTGYKGAAFPLISWMIEKGTRHIALISRNTKAPEAVENAIAKYQSEGIDIRVYAGDVADYDQMKEVFNRISEEMPSINGIVHAAGLIQANRIEDISPQEFQKILSPKQEGAWNLHRLSLSMEIEHFILFSSASSLLGLSGQGSYVAANTFIDFFAHFRNKLGLPAMAVNWGVIKDVGMVANEEELDYYARAEGFIPFNMHEGVKMLDKIFCQSPVQISIGQLDIHKTAEYYNALAETNYLENLISINEADTQKDFMLDLALQSKEECVGKIRELVIQKVSAITKASLNLISSSTTFKNLGIDSLMAIQLRNQLQKSLSIKLAVGNFWRYPSMEQFAAFVYETLNTKSSEEEVKRVTWWENRTNGKASLHLYCFHDAGGSSSLYHDWDELSDEIELRAVELPGRGNRHGEPAVADMMQLVKSLATEISLQSPATPFAFFGHSMGGAIAYEVMKELRSRNNSLPLMLFTSSTPALFSYNRSELSNQLDEKQLIERFPHLSAEIIKDESLRQEFIQIMREDLAILDSYQYISTQPFELPIVSIRGEEDSSVSLEQITLWGNETTRSHEVIERPGGHRYLIDDQTYICNLINNMLLQTVEL